MRNEVGMEICETEINASQIALRPETREVGSLELFPRRWKTIRVAYFAGTMRPGQDGVTRVMYKWIEGLNRAGIEHLFFSPITPPPAERMAPMVQIPSVAFPLYKGYRLAAPGYRHFYSRLRAFGPDVLHINSPCTLGYAALRYGQKFGVPVVATYHTHFAGMAGYYGMKSLAPIGWHYMRSLYNRCQRVYVPSQSVMEELRSHGLNRLVFLPHGVDTDAFNPAQRDPLWGNRLGAQGKRVLLYVGRLAWEKDLRVLVEAYRVLMAKRDDARFVLVGEGPARLEMERLMPQAIFLGQLSGTDLTISYASSDLFIFPSTVETFGNVTMEAMASGLPPVCARRGGAIGLIEHGSTGFLAEPGNPADFVRHVEFLLDHPEERSVISAAALARASHQGWDPVMVRLFSGYEEVMNDRAFRLASRLRSVA
jgi:phosphatidylinositol alpha 1,6-mannosyltransferase